jgi:hypothetical protein
LLLLVLVLHHPNHLPLLLHRHCRHYRHFRMNLKFLDFLLKRYMSLVLFDNLHFLHFLDFLNYLDFQLGPMMMPSQLLLLHQLCKYRSVQLNHQHLHHQHHQYNQHPLQVQVLI